MPGTGFVKQWIVPTAVTALFGVINSYGLHGELAKNLGIYLLSAVLILLILGRLRAIDVGWFVASKLVTAVELVAQEGWDIYKHKEANSTLAFLTIMVAAYLVFDGVQQVIDTTAERAQDSLADRP